MSSELNKSKKPIWASSEIKVQHSSKNQRALVTLLYAGEQPPTWHIRQQWIKVLARIESSQSTVSIGRLTCERSQLKSTCGNDWQQVPQHMRRVLQLINVIR
ncbi:hypothetical protein PoB_002982600 [Plakobranchus ocellatus]|uniref:Uncharacterized protein n=1 Tax=Plakobranchus ocellatus TaxID=259542 RepID=A0AAV4A4Z8_9GAST|nr:hypothetical protein PoB_002982600 [Plakobranchus ocellatus]